MAKSVDRNLMDEALETIKKFNQWLDGQCWELTQGVDFDEPPKKFVSRLESHQNRNRMVRKIGKFGDCVYSKIEGKRVFVQLVNHEKPSNGPSGPQ